MKKFIILLLMLFCFSFVFSDENAFVKELNYYCIIITDGDLISSKLELDPKVKNFLAGYALGINFSYEKGSIKLITAGELSFIDKKSELIEKTLGKKKYLIEKGVYNYNPPKVENYIKKYKIKLSEKSDDFWKAYKNLLINSLSYRLSKQSKGIIVPQGNLDVKLVKDGNIIITETFVVFVY